MEVLKPFRRMLGATVVIGAIALSCAKDAQAVYFNLGMFWKRLGPVLTLFPSSRDYGGLAASQSSGSFTYYLKNDTIYNAVCSPTMSISDTTNWTITNDTCTAATTINAGAYCSFDVKATPTTTGAQTLAVSKTCSGRTFTFTGIATASVAASAPTWVWPDQWAYMGLPSSVHPSANRMFYFQNFGSATATSCSAPVMTGSDTSHFTLTDVDCGTSDTARGGMCRVKVKFNPSSSGRKYGTISRTCNGTSYTTQIMGDYSGTGALTATSSFAVGEAHLCAVMSDGTVKCAGNDPSGALGNGNPWGVQGNSVVIGVGGTGTLSGISKVSNGTNHTCALATTGAVYCWGGDSAGQLGDGGTSDQWNPVQVKTSSSTYLTGVNEVSASDSYTCARASGTVYCWGDRSHAQLGDGGTSGQSSYAVQVTGITTATQITTGRYHACAILSDGTARCWGENASAQLGRGTYGSTFGTPQTVLNGASAQTGISQIAAGQEATCIRTSATLHCFGQAIESGTGVTNPWSTLVDASTTVTGLSSATAIFAGHHASGFCALNAGDLYCWGLNRAGQMNDGTFGYRTTPVKLANFATGSVATVGIGNLFSCALKTDATIKCWGDHTYTTWDGDRTMPIHVASYDGASRIVISGGAGYGIFSGALKVWGGNSSNALGTNGGDDQPTPIALSIPGNPTITDVAAGSSHACAIGGGTVYCWGNLSGFGAAPTAVDTAQVTGATQVGAGSGTACALLVGGTVKCWGSNWNGEMGIGTNDGTTAPGAAVQIASGTTMTGAVELAVGGNAACARLTDGRVRCWGSGASGQLGHGSSSSSNYAVLVQDGAVGTDLQQVTQLAAGSSTFCALLADNRVKCWGDNGFFELGRSGTSNLAGYVDNLYGVTQIAAGGAHFCALRGGLPTPEIWCWGRDGSGEGADVTWAWARQDAHLISGLPTNVTSLGGGSSFGAHMCVISGAGQTYCWGDTTGNLIDSSYFRLDDIGGF